MKMDPMFWRDVNSPDAFRQTIAAYLLRRRVIEPHLYMMMTRQPTSTRSPIIDALNEAYARFDDDRRSYDIQTDRHLAAWMRSSEGWYIVSDIIKKFAALDHDTGFAVTVALSNISEC